MGLMKATFPRDPTLLTRSQLHDFAQAAGSVGIVPSHITGRFCLQGFDPNDTFMKLLLPANPQGQEHWGRKSVF